MNQVVYVLGTGYRADVPWRYALPRIPRTRTTLTLFDYSDHSAMKMQSWSNWTGGLPPIGGPSAETPVTSVLDLYDFLKSRPPRSIIELQMFTHGWTGGPVFQNTFDNSLDPNLRDPADIDPRIKDFSIASVLGATEQRRFRSAFSSSAHIKLWGCQHDESVRRMITRRYARARTQADRDSAKENYQDTIAGFTYAYALHLAVRLPVWAAPVGWGTNPFLPFGINGAAAERTKARYRGLWPPSKGDEWWRVSPYFRVDGGYSFYKRVLRAKMDPLDYIAYSESVVTVAREMASRRVPV